MVPLVWIAGNISCCMEPLQAMSRRFWWEDWFLWFGLRGIFLAAWSHFKQCREDFGGRIGSFGLDCGEYFLLHGATSSNVEKILVGGLDPRRAGQSAGTLFGRASYLAVNASKADLYTDKD